MPSHFAKWLLPDSEDEAVVVQPPQMRNTSHSSGGEQGAEVKPTPARSTTGFGHDEIEHKKGSAMTYPYSNADSERRVVLSQHSDNHYSARETAQQSHQPLMESTRIPRRPGRPNVAALPTSDRAASSSAPYTGSHSRNHDMDDSKGSSHISASQISAFTFHPSLDASRNQGEIEHKTGTVPTYPHSTTGSERRVVLSQNSDDHNPARETAQKSSQPIMEHTRIPRRPGRPNVATLPTPDRAASSSAPYNGSHSKDHDVDDSKGSSHISASQISAFTFHPSLDTSRNQGVVDSKGPHISTSQTSAFTFQSFTRNHDVDDSKGSSHNPAHQTSAFTFQSSINSPPAPVSTAFVFRSTQNLAVGLQDPSFEAVTEPQQPREPFAARSMPSSKSSPSLRSSRSHRKKGVNVVEYSAESGEEMDRAEVSRGRETADNSIKRSGTRLKQAGCGCAKGQDDRYDSDSDCEAYQATPVDKKGKRNTQKRDLRDNKSTSTVLTAKEAIQRDGMDDEIHPDSKRIFASILRNQVKDMLGLDRLKDAYQLPTANKEEAKKFNASKGTHGGPDPDHLLLDFDDVLSSYWNEEVMRQIAILTEKALESESAIIRSRPYIRKAIYDLLTRAKGCWKKHRRQVKDDGTIETHGEVEARIREFDASSGQRNRANARQTDRWERRIQILEALILKARREKNKDDLKGYKWLLRLVKELGRGGMSSDESDGEVFVVHTMPWRGSFSQLMQYIDGKRDVSEAFTLRGTRPAQRVRREQGPISHRDPPHNLLRCLFNPVWLKDQSAPRLERFHISDDDRFKLIGIELLNAV